MLIRMNYKDIIDNWVGFVSGVLAGGVSYTLQIAWQQEWVKLCLAGLTALVAGGCGVVGKYLVVWGWKKLKYLIFKK